MPSRCAEWRKAIIKTLARMKERSVTLEENWETIPFMLHEAGVKVEVM